MFWKWATPLQPRANVLLQLESCADGKGTVQGVFSYLKRAIFLSAYGRILKQCFLIAF